MSDYEPKGPLFQHVPSNEESWFYFLNWLTMDPKSAQSNYLFLFLGIRGISEVRILDTKRGTWIRVVAKTFLERLEPETGSWTPQSEEYLLDFDFGGERFSDRKDETLLSYPQSKRIRLLFDPCESGDYTSTAASENCSYGAERKFGATAICPILVDMGDPAHRLFEGSIRWMASEAKKEHTEHMGDSAICFARFINDVFRKTVHKAFGQYASVHASIVDAHTANVRFVFCQETDMDEFFDGPPLGVEVSGAFDISLLNSEIEPYLYLDFYWMLEDDPTPGEGTEIKTKEIIAYARDAITGQSRLKPTTFEPTKECTPFTVCDPYLPDFSTKKGRDRFIGHLLIMGLQTIEAFKKASERRHEKKGATE